MEHNIKYWDNGNKYIEEYIVNGKYHRIDGPAYIDYYQDGEISNERYFINSKYHRIDGPAYIRYYKSCKIYSEAYFINGKIIPKKEIVHILEQCGDDKQLLQDILTLRYM